LGDGRDALAIELPALLLAQRGQQAQVILLDSDLTAAGPKLAFWAVFI
jgi:hypothetical protein